MLSVCNNILNFPLSLSTAYIYIYIYIYIFIYYVRACANDIIRFYIIIIIENLICIRSRLSVGRPGNGVRFRKEEKVFFFFNFFFFLF